MTHFQFLPFFFIMLMLVILAYRRRRERASGRRGVRHITGYGVVFCVLSFSLWSLTRMDDIISSLPGSHQSDLFATPWLWVTSLLVGITLLVISFFTRKVRRDETPAA